MPLPIDGATTRSMSKPAGQIGKAGPCMGARMLVELRRTSDYLPYGEHSIVVNRLVCPVFPVVSAPVGGFR